jgi:phosphoribosylaminoimidazolecarboxamide formyltransferase / IMP cyclohydrolase
MSLRLVKRVLVSVYDKQGLEPLLRRLQEGGATFVSTGGTRSFIESLGINCDAVEDLTGYPSILDGRVKTLHPAVFGGILAIRNPDHQAQLTQYEIPEIDAVIVDLYPFEDTVATTNDEPTIIEKIDIGGISLIRAAAKNFGDVICIPSKAQYPVLLDMFDANGAIATTLEQRRMLAREAFAVSSHYDTAIHNWMAGDDSTYMKRSYLDSRTLRYGENPHQKGYFYGKLEDVFDQIQGKELSFNNLVDVDSAVQLIAEFGDSKPTFAILKHTNACGLATGETLAQAWDRALAADPVSAFGGILICNKRVDIATAEKIKDLFFEVLIAPDFDQETLALFATKKQRILLRQKDRAVQPIGFRSLLNGIIAQDADQHTETDVDLKIATEVEPHPAEMADLIFAIKAVKHLKSNGIAIVKDEVMLTMGCGQTSRVDALRHAIEKAKAFGQDISGAVMASEAFFPFPDCVEIAAEAGLTAVAQPGGSVRDQDSIDACNKLGMAMVMTGYRHFKH